MLPSAMGHLDRTSARCQMYDQAVTRSIAIVAFALTPFAADVTHANAERPNVLSHSEIVEFATTHTKRAHTVEILADGRARIAAPMQDLWAEIDPKRLTLRSVDNAGAATFDVRTKALGRSGHVSRQRVGRLSIVGDQVSIVRPAIVEEFSATAEGIRQDFILASRPPGTGPLWLDLNFRGAELRSLRPADSSAVGLRLADGRELHYHALLATDSEMHEMSARMEVISGNQLRIIIDDEGARYPIRIDPTFSDADWTALEVPGFNEPIHALAVGGGDLYAGGRFTAANGITANYVARWNGSAWQALGAGTSGSVYALAWDSVGNRLFAGGFFATAGGVAANNIAQWNGTSWSSVAGGVNDGPGGSYVLAMAWDATGGRLFVGGVFQRAGQLAASNIAQWNGSAWSALGAGMPTAVRALAWDSDGGRLFAGGNFSMAGGIPANRIAQWNGSAWAALGSGTNVDVYSLAWDAKGGRLFAGGDFFIAGGVSAQGVAQWDGIEWSALGLGLQSRVHALLWDANFGILFAHGAIPGIGTAVARWNGNAWSVVGLMPGGDVFGMAQEGSSGRLFVGGDFSNVGGTAANRVAQWNSSSWSALGGGMNGDVRALALDGSGGRLFVAGTFSTAGTAAASNVAQWDGSMWSPLGSGTNATVLALAWDANGNRLFATGEFTLAGGVVANRVAQWNGSVWSPLGVGIGSSGWTMLWDTTNQRLLVGGRFTFAGGASANRIASWNGTAWSPLGAGLGNGTVEALALDEVGNRLFAGGTFTSAGGMNIPYVAQWDGSVWSALGSGTNSAVAALSWDSVNDHLYAGGNFSTAGGLNAPKVARWNGKEWAALGGGLSPGPVTSLVWDGSGGRLFAGGRISSAGGESVSNVAQWNGSEWASIGTGTDSWVLDLAWDESRARLYAGGTFVVAGGQPARVATIRVPMSQAVLVAIAQPPVVPFGGVSTLSTTGGSGTGAVTYAVTAGSGICELSGASVTGIAIGNCVVTATKAADERYSEATATVDVSITTSGIADLQVAKDAGIEQASVGDTLLYVITATNAGPDNVAEAVLIDVPPTSLANPVWACVPAQSTATCPPPPYDAGVGSMDVRFNLPTGTYLRYELAATLQGGVGGSVSNTASIAPPIWIDDPVMANSATDSILIAPDGILIDSFESLSMPLTVPSAAKAHLEAIKRLN